LEDVIRLFRERLFSSLYDWLEVNKEAIGEKWYGQLVERAKDAEDECNSAIKIMGTALWMFNMISNCGVMAGVGPDSISDQTDYKETELDEKSTKRMLLLIQACLNLQYLPVEAAKQEIPIISGTKFSLKLFTQQRS
jgi:hypothetical protein